MASAVQVFSFSLYPMWYLCSAYRLWNGQNDRAADIEDGVQRGLGTLPQQAVLQKRVNLYRFTLLANMWMSILRLKPIPDLGFFMEQLCAKLARSSNIYFYFRPTWSKVKFLKSHTPKDNFIPIWDEVKILRFVTFRQVVGKFFQKSIPGRLPRIDMKFKSQLRCNLHWS